MTFRVLVADALDQEGLEILAEAGEITTHNGLEEDALRSALPGVHALIVRSATVVTARALEGADQLAVIGRAGIGIDNIDVDAATARGIAVMNTPEANAATAAEHAIALLVSLARNIAAADASMKAGQWERRRFLGVELRDKVFGVLGLGRIGGIVARRGVGLAMEVVACDPFVLQGKAPPGVRMVSLEELLANADFVSVHVPLNDDTRGLLNAERLRSMKSGARLVHAARGGIVDEQALIGVLRDGHLAGAALDVFEEEPLPADHPLRHLDNVLLTPHLGASTAEAQRNVALDIARQIVLCLKKGVFLNGVNVPRVAPSDAAQVAPFMDLVKNLAGFLVQVHRGRLQSLRLTVQGGLPQDAHHPLLVAALVGALRPGADGPMTPVNAERAAAECGVRVHVESSSMKRDFMNLLRVEVVIDEERHFVSGTVLGHRHGRLVEYDHYLLDAIPEPPLLVTFHDDSPGVLGRMCTVLGERGINIDRMQLGPGDGQGAALGVFNLSARPSDEDLAVLGQVAALRRVVRVG